MIEKGSVGMADRDGHKGHDWHTLLFIAVISLPPDCYSSAGHLLTAAHSSRASDCLRVQHLRKLAEVN